MRSSHRGLFAPKAGRHCLGKSGEDQGYVILPKGEDTEDFKLGLGFITPWE